MNNEKSITPNTPADFTPSMGSYQTLQPFRYWCQKVLPLVYDDSLSYYELLCKVVDYLNKAMEDVETLHDDVTNLHTAYDELQSYVNNYFSTLDMQEEVNNKLDNMANSGELYEIIRKYTNPIVNEQNEKINVLKSRMDTFTSLPDGSTAGDAELQDIRIGYNGKVYPNAGDAVRIQVSQLSEEIVANGNEVSVLKLVSAIQNGHIKENGEVYEYPTNQTLYIFCVDGLSEVTVSSGDVYGFFTSLPTIGSVTYNASREVTTLANTTITVPNECSYIAVRSLEEVVCSYKTYIQENVVKNSNFYMRKIFDILARCTWKSEQAMSGTESSGYVNSSGNVVANVNFKNITYSVTEGDMLFVSQIVTSSAVRYVLLNGDKVVGYAEPDNLDSITRNEYLLCIPKNVNKVIFNHAISSGEDYTIYEITQVRDMDVDWKLGDSTTKIYSQRGTNNAIHHYVDMSVLGAFRKIGVVGDSLSVGWIYDKETQKASRRNLDYSWVQFMARKLGNTCVNLGESGVSTRTWFTSEYCWTLAQQTENKCQAYIIALGVNDQFDDTLPLGTIADVNVSNPDSCADTYYGNYAKIILKLQAINPKAKFFVFTMPYPYANNNYGDAIKAIANLIDNVYVVDLYANYNDYFTSGVIPNDRLEKHYTAIGYNAIANVNIKAISDVIAENYEDFQDIFTIPYGN